MENQTMGKVLVRAKIENMEDLFDVHKGLLKPEQVIAVEVPDALVDTGASTLLMPKRLFSQLGLRYLYTRPGQGLGGPRSIHMYSICPLDN